jgi:hypothetical protein
MLLYRLPTFQKFRTQDRSGLQRNFQMEFILFYIVLRKRGQSVGRVFSGKQQYQTVLCVCRLVNVPHRKSSTTVPVFTCKKEVQSNIVLGKILHGLKRIILLGYCDTRATTLAKPPPNPTWIATIRDITFVLRFFPRFICSCASEGHRLLRKRISQRTWHVSNMTMHLHGAVLSKGPRPVADCYRLTNHLGFSCFQHLWPCSGLVVSCMEMIFGIIHQVFSTTPAGANKVNRLFHKFARIGRNRDLFMFLTVILLFA